MSDHGDIGCEEALKRLLAFIDGELSDGEERDDRGAPRAHVSQLFLTDGVRAPAQAAAVGAARPVTCRRSCVTGSDEVIKGF